MNNKLVRKRAVQDWSLFFFVHPVLTDNLGPSHQLVDPLHASFILDHFEVKAVRMEYEILHLYLDEMSMIPRSVC